MRFYLFIWKPTKGNESIEDISHCAIWVLSVTANFATSNIFCIFFMNMNLTVPFLNIYMIEYVSNIYTAELSERTRSSTLLIIHWNFLDLMCVDFRASRTWLKEVEKKPYNDILLQNLFATCWRIMTSSHECLFFFLSNKNVKKKNVMEKNVKRIQFQWSVG